MTDQISPCCFCLVVEITVTWNDTDETVWDIPPFMEPIGSLTWWAHDSCFREALKPEVRPFTRSY